MVYKIIAISGSLSKHSINSGLIRACLLTNNPDLSIQILDVSTFPLFNMDPILQQGFPANVQHARQRVYQADGVIFASPEHNYKLSSVTKNAYDWLSFTLNPQVAPPIKQKPTAFISCSLSGSVKAFEHFQRVCQYCKVQVMDKPLLLKKEEGDYDQNGNIMKVSLFVQVQAFLLNFDSFLKHLKK